MNGAPRSAAQENLERHPICRQCTRRRPLHRPSGPRSVGVAARRPAAAASGRPISANPGPSAGPSREGSCRSCLLLVRSAWVRFEHRHARRCGAQVAMGLRDARRRTGRQCVRGACGDRAAAQEVAASGLQRRGAVRRRPRAQRARRVRVRLSSAEAGRRSQARSASGRDDEQHGLAAGAARSRPGWPTRPRPAAHRRHALAGSGKTPAFGTRARRR